MAIFQSAWGTGRKVAPTASEAGVSVVEQFQFVVSKNLASTDVIELGILPAYHTVTDAVLITDSLGSGVTVNVGIMSGVPGNPDASRTCGNELFASAANNSVVRMSKPVCFQIAPTEADRSIGVRVSGAVTANDQKILLVLTYKQ